jgi:hypothetical protein
MHGARAQYKHPFQRSSVRREAALYAPWKFIEFNEQFIYLDFASNIPVGWTEAGESDETGVSGLLDSHGGGMILYCDADDNDQKILHTDSEFVKFQSGKGGFALFRIKHTAVSTDGKGTWAIGLSDTVAADIIADAGTIMASFDGALFFKGEDAGNIVLVTSNATEQASTVIAPWVDGNDVFLGIEWDTQDSKTTGKLRIRAYYGTDIDDMALVADNIELTLAGLAEMHGVMTVKTHEAGEQSIEVRQFYVLADR